MIQLNKNELNLIIMQGVPGSGKSYAAKELLKHYYPDGEDKDACIISTDEFWYLENGKYDFNMEKLGKAHTWNHGRAYQAMRMKVPLVIIDNTNISAKEYNPYIKFGKKFGYTHQICRSNAPWANDAMECFKRNTHNVPLEVIQKMLSRLNGTQKEEIKFDKTDNSTVCFHCESQLRKDENYIGNNSRYLCINGDCCAIYYLNASESI